MKIGVLDSGLGGLSILKYLTKAYPNNEYIYFGDNGNAPYGSKEKEFIKSRADFIFNFLINKNVDIIIVACNTIDSLYYEEYEKYKKPIYGIIKPFIKDINEMNYQKLGLIATPSTINANLYQSLIKKSLIAKATKDLVQIIENNEIYEKYDIIKNSVEEFTNSVDALILGCTHYEIITKEIENIVNIPLLFNGDSLVKSLQKVIKSETSYSLVIYTTGKKETYINYIHTNYEIYEV